MVTGGTSGIGKVTALAFGQEGAKVVVSGRRVAEGEAVVQSIRQEGGEALFVQADVSREADVQALVAKTLEAYGRLDVAVNNAGVELFKPLTDTTEEEYDRVIDINVKGVFLSLKHQIPALLQSGGGSIINISSVAGQIGMAGASVYIASKHAVNGLTRAAAIEYARQGIRVNAVAPGAIKTEMFDRLTGGDDTDIYKFMETMHPVGRVGTSEEIASAVLWLASSGASFVTGQIIPVDGGVTTQ